MDSAIWGLIGTIVGAAASVITTWLTASNETKREQAARREERFERARDFQRQTLIELQDVLHDTVRLVSKAHHEDCMAAKNGQSWGKNMLPSELDEAVRLAQRRANILAERIADDDLRQALKSFLALLASVLLARNETESWSGIDKINNEWPLLLERTGKLLRQYY